MPPCPIMYVDPTQEDAKKFVAENIKPGRIEYLEPLSDCIKNKLIKWFATGKVGTSSKNMACIAAGMPHHPFACYPHDPSDFSRCLLLVNEVPEVRNCFEQIASLSPQWNALIQNWDELEKTFIDEAGLDWCKATSAPNTHALMRTVLSRA